MPNEQDKPNRGGQPSRGDRSNVTVRVPVEHRAVYEARADELGIALGSWIALKLAEAEGLEVPDYLKRELARGAHRTPVSRRGKGRPVARMA